ncbi:MAB_1171c family putative transporter [Streptomyces sp. NPDC007084]|uniref:MAB_1171c family putative transporter n=1 Tax=Streptomyces sp. NPDC007084 TaxID=3154313 RepID=UPI003456A946
MDSGVIFYVPGVALLTVLTLKARSLKDTWRDPLIASSNAILLIGALVCVLSAPPTITVVNAATGIANFSAPLVYCGMTALSAGYLVLMTAWRGGPRHRLEQRVLLIGAASALVVSGILVLFALADVPVERTRDLDTYYAGTPYMREMILLYLAFHTVASLLLTGMCLSWVRVVTGITRTGLVLVVIGACFDLSFQAAKYAALGARWNGRDWDFLSTDVSPPLVATAGIFVATGFALPRLGPSLADTLRARRRCRMLKPLWAEVRGLPAPDGAAVPWWTPPTVRLTRQEIAILDGVLACGPYLDPTVRDSAYAEALRQPVAGRSARARRGTAVRLTPLEQATVVADAAMLAAARARMAGGRHEPCEADRAGMLDSMEKPHLRVGLAQALRSSPVVAAARRRAAPQDAPRN